MRVRLKAWVESMGNGTYRVHTNQGSVTYPTYDYQSVIRQVDAINNEDSEGHYFDDGRLSEEEEKILAEMRERKLERERARNARLEAQAKRSAERKKKEQKKVENNRKSKRSNDKYVYVISIIERGGGNTTEYFKGDTNLLKFKDFTVYEVKDAKVFITKASAQKMVDMLSKNRLINKMYRNLKVVQKKRELFISND